MIFTWAGCVDDLGTGRDDLLVDQRGGSMDHGGSVVDQGSGVNKRCGVVHDWGSVVNDWGDSVDGRSALGDDRVESVDWISGVVHGTHGTVRLD